MSAGCIGSQVSVRTMRMIPSCGCILLSALLFVHTVFGEQYPRVIPAEDFSEGLKQFGLLKMFEPVPFSAPEIGNPMRGLYRWMNLEMVDAPLYDSYVRLTWNTIESDAAPGVFDFESIDRWIQYISNRGGCFAFRVTAYSPGDRFSNALPAYLAKSEFGFRDDRGYFVPDWNHPYFLERVEALLQALGERYNNHPNVFCIDLGIYGKWGEWHVHGLRYPGPNQEKDITDASAQKIIDLYARYFPDKWLTIRVNNHHAKWAIQKYPKMGCRADSVANMGFYPERSETRWMEDRWKRAPFITETWSGTHPLTSVWLAAEHVAKFHVAMLGNGNITKDHRLTDKAEIAEFQKAGKLAGYRFELGAVAVPGQMTNGSLMTIASKWRNVGVTPSYLPWDVNWQLRSSDNTVACQWTSALDLMRSMPTLTESLRIDDLCYVPQSLPSGTYALTLRIDDPARVRKPLALAIQSARSTDGSYTIGTVTVVSAPGHALSPANAKIMIDTNRAAFAAIQEALVENYRDPPLCDLTEPPAPGVYECLADANAFIQGGKNGNTALKSPEVMKIRSDGGDWERQMLIRFDLSTVPDGKAITEAKVKIYAVRVGESNAVPNNAALIGNGWTEDAVSFNSVPSTLIESLARWELPKGDPVVVIDVTGQVSKLLSAGGDRRLSLRISGVNPTKWSPWEVMEYAGRTYPDARVTPRMIIKVK